MKLGELAAEVPGSAVLAGAEHEVEGLSYDSRTARPGDLFVALRGHRTDSHRFARELSARGVAVAVEDASGLAAGSPALQLADTRLGLAQLAAAFYGHPTRRLLVAGVTGTDGKTTVAHMAAHVLKASGLRAGLSTTVGVDTGDGRLTNVSGLTTTGPVELQEALRAMVDAGLQAVVVEASSHALVQHRVAACDFDVAAFTNVGRDHLEYHATWEAYLEAKARLIDLCQSSFNKGIDKTAVLNRDDQSFAPLAQHTITRRLSYSLQTDAELTAEQIEVTETGSRFVLRQGSQGARVELRVAARFNIANALCAAGACLALGLTLEQVAGGLGSFTGAPGRLEEVVLGQPFRVYIDYAHSASSLASVLQALRASTSGRLIAVFGSTARSDHDRPGMGEAASRHADHFVITTDDPIDEDPAEIAHQVASGARDGGTHEVVLDRGQAIARAVELARPGDTVLLAGKGHEHFMLYEGRRRVDWDERGAAEDAIRRVWRGAG